MKSANKKDCTLDLLQMLCMEQWSNSACNGYAILAGQQLCYSRSQINDFLTVLNAVYEQHTVEEAKRIYMNY